jgi:sugar-specific transcriptional regulator TrmB
MEVGKVLEEIGLSEGEIKVYLALLKLGSVPVSDIKEESGLHRTTIYDFLEKLLNKGLVNFVIRKGVKFYKATSPEKLLDHLKEKESRLEEVMPSLEKLVRFQKEEINVEVYRGREGIKTMLNDMLKEKCEVLGYGLNEYYWQENFPLIMERYFKEAKMMGINERLLTHDKAEFIFEKETTVYKYIPYEYFNPTPTFIWRNKVSIIIWEPLTLIMIENPELSDSYRKYFNMLWKISKERPKELK